MVRSLPDLLRAAQPVFDRTGGVHGAALVTAAGEVLVVREDIGRHNAVDKVTGARVLAGQSPAEACLVVSGRAGFELAQKAVAAGRRRAGRGGCAVQPDRAAGAGDRAAASTASPRPTTVRDATPPDRAAGICVVRPMSATVEGY